MKKSFGLILILSAILFMSAKFTDDTLRLGPAGSTSKIIFSGGDGVIQYNTTNARWEFADDGIDFKEFGAEVTSDEFTIYQAVFLEERALIPSDVTDLNPQNPTLGPQEPAGWLTAITRRIHPTTEARLLGSNKATFKVGLFTAPPVCWASSPAAYVLLSDFSTTGIGMVNRFNAIGRSRLSGNVYLWCMRGNE